MIGLNVLHEIFLQTSETHKLANPLNMISVFGNHLRFHNPKTPKFLISQSEP